MIDLDFIRELVENETKIEIKKSKIKANTIEVEAKALFCELANLFTEFSEMEVSTYLGYKSHATVLNYREKSYYRDFYDYKFPIERKRLISRLKMLTNKRAISLKKDIVNEINHLESIISSFSLKLKVIKEEFKDIK